MPVAGTVWEVRTTGNDANGGGYSSGGTDYSQQDAPQLTVADAAATGTTNLSSATGGFTSAMVGNVVNVVGQGRRTITAFVNGNNVTCNAVWGTFSGATANVGGALASPAIAADSSVAANSSTRCVIHLELGSYTISSTSANVSNGRVVLKSHTTLVGYDQVRGDLTGNRPSLVASGISSTNLVTISGGDAQYIRNVTLDGSSLTGMTGYGGGANSWGISHCFATRCVTGFLLSGRGFAFRCSASSCTTGFAVSNTACAYCYAEACVTGFGGTGMGSAYGCIAYNCSQRGFQIFEGLRAMCVAYECVNSFESDKLGLIINSVAYRSTPSNVGGGHLVLSINNANNGSGIANVQEGFVSLAQDPFVDAANGDFSLNAYGKSVLVGEGYGTFPSPITSTSFPDIGAVQMPGQSSSIPPFRRQP